MRTTAAGRIRLAAGLAAGGLLLVAAGTGWVVLEPGRHDVATASLVLVVGALLVVGGAVAVLISVAGDLERVGKVIAATTVRRGQSTDADRRALPQDLRQMVDDVQRLERRVVEAERALAAGAARDPATGVLTQRELLVRLHGEVERVRRHGGSVSLLAIRIAQLDGMTAQVADAAVDEVLRAVGVLLTGAARPSDTAARLDDGFAVILPETDAAGADVAARRLVEATGSTPVTAEEAGVLHVSLHVGVATMPDVALTAEDLVAAAQEGLERADDDTPVAKGRR